MGRPVGKWAGPERKCAGMVHRGAEHGYRNIPARRRTARNGTGPVQDLAQEPLPLNGFAKGCRVLVRVCPQQARPAGKS